jgi:hypothetical protein
MGNTWYRGSAIRSDITCQLPSDDGTNLEQLLRATKSKNLVFSRGTVPSMALASYRAAEMQTRTPKGRCFRDMEKSAILLRSVAFFTALFLLGSIPALAALTGDIQGTVLDPKGLAIAGARVTVRNVGTQAARVAITDEQGQFSVLQLDIGDYDVRIEKDGFSTALLGTVAVRSGETVRLNAPLQVGSLSQTVTVEAAAQIIDTADAQVTASFDAQKVANLPNLGRDPMAYATLVPGTVPVTKDNSFLSSGDFNINGQRGRAINITVDNAVATDITATGFLPGLGPFSLDSVQEVKVIAGVGNAEFGRNSGAQVQIITKSGTNEIHGTAYWFLRNAALNARDFFDKTGKATPFIGNLWGFEAGGPAIKDHLFLYGHYEGDSQRGLGSTSVGTVLTPAQAAAITDPTSKALFAAVGAPTSPTGQLSSAAPNTVDEYSWSLRGDEHFHDGKDAIFARFSMNPGTVVNPGLTFVLGLTRLPNYGAIEVRKDQISGLGWTRTFSPALVNQARFQFERSRLDFQPFTTLTPPYVGTLEISGFDVMGVGRIFPQGRTQNVFQGSDSFSWSTGRHALKFGGDVYRYQANSFFDSSFRGRFGYSSLGNFQNGILARYRQTLALTTDRGYRATDFSMYAQDDLRVSRTLTLSYGLRLESSGGVSEVNRILSNLDQNAFLPIGGGGTGALGTPEVGGQAFGRNNNWAPRLGVAWNPHAGNWVVRGGYGWAYDYLFLNPVSNLLFSAPYVYGIDISGATISGSNSYANLAAGTGQIQLEGKAGAASQTFPADFKNFGSISPVQQDLKNPRTVQWTVTVERKVGKTLALKASYIGVQTKFLQVSVPINLIPQEKRPAPATSLADETARLAQFTTAFSLENGTLNGSTVNDRLDPRFNTVMQVQSIGDSIYHAFQFEAVKQYGNGLTLRGTYTWGHSIDDTSDALAVLINDDPNVQDPRNVLNNRANSEFDIRHRVTLSHVYDIPFARRFTGIRRKALDGWSFSGIFTFQTGLPATLFAGSRLGISDNALLAGGLVRVNGDPTLLQPTPAGSAAAAVSAANNPISSSTLLATVGTVTQPLLGNFGNSPRNALRLADLTDFDWSFYKTTKVTERLALQFRWEIYNVFNHANFGVLNNVRTSPFFGTYTSTATDQRKMQFALKVIF